jgi:hypothetical protein
MKKNLVLILVLIAFGSCKKKYNCRCGTTVLFNNGQDQYLSKNVQISEKLTEKQAQSICLREADDINTTYNNLITNNGNQSANGVTAKTNCSVE